MNSDEKIQTVIEAIKAVTLGSIKPLEGLNEEVLELAKQTLIYLVVSSGLSKDAKAMIEGKNGHIIATVVHDMLSSGYEIQLNELLKKLSFRFLLDSRTIKEGCVIYVWNIPADVELPVFATPNRG